MSDTPKTDMFCRTVDHTAIVGGKIYQATIETVDASLARQLERELAEARADLRLAKNIIETHVERVAERDKLIEQMREALKIADILIDDLVDTHVEKCASVYDDDRNEIKAALSAAERGEV